MFPATSFSWTKAWVENPGTTAEALKKMPVGQEEGHYSKLEKKSVEGNPGTTDLMLKTGAILKCLW